MSDSSSSEAEEETREFTTVREEREARVDMQHMIESANDLLESAGLPEGQEMMEGEENNEAENSDSDDSSLQNSSSDGDISLEDIMPAAVVRRIRRRDQEREVPERINVREAELKKEWMRKLETFPMRYV